MAEKISQQRWRARLDKAVGFLNELGVFEYGITYDEILALAMDLDFLDADDKQGLAKLFALGLAENNGEKFDFDGEALADKDYEYVRIHFPKQIFVKLAEETDFASMLDAEQEEFRRQERKKEIRNYKVAGVLLLVFIVIIGIYNLSYFAEKRAFNQVKGDPTKHNAEEYLEKYGDSKNAPEVTYLLMQFYLRNSKDEFYDNSFSSKELGLTKALQYIDTLQLRFPNSEFTQKANTSYDSIWNAEINKYVKDNPDYSTSKSKLAMYNMLQYMKANKIHEINLEITPDVQLKDFDDFGTSTISFFNSFGIESSDVSKLKEYFSESMLKDLELELRDQIKEALNKVFTPGFISLRLNEGDSAKDQIKPVIKFDYGIKNQMERYMGRVIPMLWSEENSQYIYLRRHHILGITMAFDASISYPGHSDVQFINAIGDPGENIEGVQTTQEGYEKMATQCFADFANQLCKALGIESENQNK